MSRSCLFLSASAAIFVAGHAAAGQINLAPNVALGCLQAPGFKTIVVGSDKARLVSVERGVATVDWGELGTMVGVVCGMWGVSGKDFDSDVWVTGDADFPRRVGSELNLSLVMRLAGQRPTPKIKLTYRVTGRELSRNSAIPGYLHAVSPTNGGTTLYWSENYNWFIGNEPNKVAFDGSTPRFDTQFAKGEAEVPVAPVAPTAPKIQDDFPILSEYVGKTYFSSSDYKGYRFALLSNERKFIISLFGQKGVFDRLTIVPEPGKHTYTAIVGGKKRKAEIVGGELTIYTGGGDKDIYSFSRDAASILVRRYVKDGILPTYTYWGGGTYSAVTDEQLASFGAQYGSFLAERQRREREADRERREQGAAFYSGLNSIAQAYSGAVNQQYSDQQASQAVLSNLASQLQSKRPEPQRQEPRAQSAAVATVAPPNTSGSAPTRRVTQPETRPASTTRPVGAPSTNTDANRCISSPELRENDTTRGNTAAYVVNGCSEPVDVRICLKRDGAWNCGVRYGLPAQQRWSWSSFNYSGGVFVDARTSGSDKLLASP